jgi:hypothetical protein
LASTQSGNFTQTKIDPKSETKAKVPISRQPVVAFSMYLKTNLAQDLGLRGGVHDELNPRDVRQTTIAPGLIRLTGELRDDGPIRNRRQRHEPIPFEITFPSNVTLTEIQMRVREHALSVLDERALYKQAAEDQAVRDLHDKEQSGQNRQHYEMYFND